MDLLLQDCAALCVAKKLMTFHFRIVLHKDDPNVARHLMISYFRTVLHEAVLCVAIDC